MYDEEKKVMDQAISTYRKGDIEKAENMFRDFIKQYPTSSLADNACYNLAKIAYEKGDKHSASSWYEYLLTNYPDSDAAYFGQDEYVELCHELGKEIAEVSDECYFNAVASFKKGSIAEAESEFKRLIEQFPECEYVDNAYYHLGLICKRRGDLEGAKNYANIILTQYADTDAALQCSVLLGEPVNG